MSDAAPAYVGNLSTLYRGLPLAERAGAAKADGFARVESWWDFDSATPPAAEIDAFASSIEAAGVELVALNSHGGDRAAGERGMASLPGREAEFRASIDAVVALAERLGPRKFNVAAGNRMAGVDEEDQRAIAAGNYRYATEAVGAIGGTVLIEALSQIDSPDYLFRTGHDVVAFLGEADLDEAPIGFLFDTYHLASNGLDVVEAWGALEPAVRHVQLADAPGRGAPGTGGIDFTAFLDAVASSPYAGDISLEYLDHRGPTA